MCTFCVKRNVASVNWMKKLHDNAEIYWMMGGGAFHHVEDPIRLGQEEKVEMDQDFVESDPMVPVEVAVIAEAEEGVKGVASGKMNRCVVAPNVD